MATHTYTTTISTFPAFTTIFQSLLGTSLTAVTTLYSGTAIVTTVTTTDGVPSSTLASGVASSASSASSSDPSSQTPSTQSASTGVASSSGSEATVASNSNSATSSITPSRTSGPLPKPKGGSLNPGAVAGVAIGTFLVGAFIAAFIVFLLMKKRSSGGGHRRKDARSNGAPYRDHDDERRVGDLNEIILSENLLERADDSQIKQHMVNLDEVIDQHCVNHYHLDSVTASQDWEKRLADAGYSRLVKLGPTSAEMAALLQNPRSRIATIRYLIALVILSHIDWRAHPDVSLLPPQIAGFCYTIAPVEKLANSQVVFDKAFNTWRQISAFLIEPFRSNRESPKADRNDLIEPIRRNVAQINTVLAPFIISTRAQEDNLSAIAFEAAQIGILLFSQPSEWILLWEATKEDAALISREQRGAPLVVFPALAERTAKRGEVRNRMVVGVKQIYV